MPISVCFVCLGNICRSPTAEGVMQKLVQSAGLADHILIDSAGTGAYHVGELADPRSRATALARGVKITSISRKFVAEDFDRFDYVIAMDRGNLANLVRQATKDAHRSKIHLLRFFDPESDDDASVPDPYYDDGFDRVFDMCMAGCKGLLDHMVREHQLPPRR